MAVTDGPEARPDRPDVGPEPGEWLPGPDGSAITSLTTASPLRAGVVPGAARTLLERLPAGDHSPFATSGRTHFARLQVLDELMTHERRPLAAPVLILSADVDGDAGSWLLEVLDAAPDTFASVLALCEGAPGDGSADGFARAAAAYLLDHRIPVGLQYANSPGRTAAQVRLAVERHRRLAGFALGHRRDPPAELRAAFLREFTPPTATDGDVAGERPGQRSEVPR